VDSDRIRDTADWLAAQAERRTETMDTATELHNVAAANLLSPGDRESDREHPDRTPGHSDHDGAGQRAGHDARAAHADEMNAAVERQQEHSEAAALFDRWANGAPSAQLAGKAHPVGRDSDTRRQTVKKGKNLGQAIKSRTKDNGLTR
ncbi:MAG: hypothetical protein ACXVXQ_06530, partial [Mycobacteriaceae bacterium]